MDKESMAMLQNKRQEFRCNQVVKAVNKEKDLRERELSYENNQFKARLQKLIDKRKELNLDPIKTRELEMLMVPGLRAKSRGPSPERKISPGILPGLRVTDDAGKDVFVTDLSCSTKHIVEDNKVVVDLLQSSIDRASADRNSDVEEGVTLEGNGQDKSVLHDDILPGLKTAAISVDSSTAETLPNYPTQSGTQKARKISEGLGGGTVLQPCYEGTNQPSIFKKSASDLRAKLGNVQQWLSDIEVDTNRNETRLKQRSKRHSTSS